MKIALYYNLKFGGAKRVVKDQTKELSKLGHVIDVFTINCEDDVFSPEIFSNKSFKYNFNTPFIMLPIVGKLFHLYYSFYGLKKLQKEIARDIDKKKYDIVLVHPDKYTQAPFILRFLKTKSVYYCQEPYRIAYEHSMRIDDSLHFLKRLYENLFRHFMKVVDRNNIRFSNFTIASCNYVRERMIESYDVYPYVSYPGIDTDVFRPRKVKTKKGILFLGSKTNDIDGYELLDSALKLIPRKIRPDVKLVTWVKDNSQRLTERELVDIYSEVFITACMTKLETFGLIPLESMACGTPIIATNVSGHRETILNNKTGILVDHDPVQIANAIIELTNKKSIYKKMKAAGVAHVRKNWSIKKRNMELSELLINLAKKK